MELRVIIYFFFGMMETDNESMTHGNLQKKGLRPSIKDKGAESPCLKIILYFNRSYPVNPVLSSSPLRHQFN